MGRKQWIELLDVGYKSETKEILRGSSPDKGSQLDLSCNKNSCALYSPSPRHNGLLGSPEDVPRCRLSMEILVSIFSQIFLGYQAADFVSIVKKYFQKFLKK
jgi:hypothetical protein